MGTVVTSNKHTHEFDFDFEASELAAKKPHVSSRVWHILVPPKTQGAKALPYMGMPRPYAL